MFACFPAVIFLTSPFAGPFMSRHGKKWVYTTGLIVVAISTICFSVASYMPAGSPFATWCPPPNTHTRDPLRGASRRPVGLGGARGPAASLHTSSATALSGCCPSLY